MFHNLSLAIEYAALYEQFITAAYLDGCTYIAMDRETFYWEHIARPFARSHGCNC